MVQRESAEGWCAVPKAAPLDPKQYNKPNEFGTKKHEFGMKNNEFGIASKESIFLKTKYLCNQPANFPVFPRFPTFLVFPPFPHVSSILKNHCKICFRFARFLAKRPLNPSVPPEENLPNSSTP